MGNTFVFRSYAPFFCVLFFSQTLLSFTAITFYFSIHISRKKCVLQCGRFSSNESSPSTTMLFLDIPSSSLLRYCTAAEEKKILDRKLPLAIKSNANTRANIDHQKIEELSHVFYFVCFYVWSCKVNPFPLKQFGPIPLFTN